MLSILFIVLTILLTYAGFLVFQTVGGKLFGGKIEEIGLFLSPKIFKFKAVGIIFSLNAIPLGCFVKFNDDFQNLHPVKKCLIVLSGLLSYLIIAFFCLGFAETFHQIISGFSQIFYGMISPIAIGAGYFEKFAAILKEKSFIRGVGILESKYMAFHLIPLGTLSGGNLLLYGLEIFGIKSESFKEKYQLFGLILLLPVYIAYLIAFFVFIWRSLVN